MNCALFVSSLLAILLLRLVSIVPLSPLVRSDRSNMATLHHFDWLFAIGVLFFCLSIWGIGANDVANSYATSVSSKSLTLPQAGVLATCTEFVGAMALGQKVTDTIRHGVFGFEPFAESPGVLLMAMVVAEIGMSTWLF